MQNTELFKMVVTYIYCAEIQVLIFCLPYDTNIRNLEVIKAGRA